jgi:uncharacterized protein (TIGR02145 family)
VGLIAFVFIFLSLLPQPQPATATPLVASTPTISLTAPTTATLTVTPNTSLPTTASSSISVTTNNTTGYNLFATTQDDTNDCLRNSADIATDCPDLNATNKITNTVGTSTTLTNNTWGVSLDSGATWRGVPLLGQPVLNIKSTTTTATNDTSTVTYGVKVDSSLPAGTYSGTVIITAIANVVPAPTITSVTPNYGSIYGGTNIIITGTGFDSAHEVTIGGSDCENTNIVSSTQITCTTPISTSFDNRIRYVDVVVKNWGNTVTRVNGFIYQAPPPSIISVSPSSGLVTGGTNITITGNHFIEVTNVYIDEQVCASLTVVSITQITCITPPHSAGTYSVSVQVSNGSTSMSNMFTYTEIPFSSFSSTSCANMSALAIINLLDTRNNQVYRVRKMQDNKCWMIDNLKIINITVTNANTNLTGGLTSFTIPSASHEQSSDVPHVFSTSGITYCDTTVYTENTASKTGCGYLYNWPAATAGTGTSATTSGITATSSICPINFRLPAGVGAAGDFAYLNGMMAGDGAASTTNNVAHATHWRPTGSWQGVYSGAGANVLSNQGTQGQLWGSTASSATDVAGGLAHGASTVSVTAGMSKSGGRAIRCVAI